MSSKNEDPFFSNLPAFCLLTVLEGCGTEAVQRLMVRSWCCVVLAECCDGLENKQKRNI